jgi:cytochrome P450/NADPH-cytochrome P450 reductase
MDLLEEFSACELPFSAYLEMLPPLRPRYYSISSSPLEQPDTAAITVAVVKEAARSGKGLYRGVCSNYLDEQGVGDVVHAFVKDTKSAFRLPADPKLPVIMIGPGTGLAPFRGFLQERGRLKASGKSVGPSHLFFGCRHPETDFIYADELKAWERDGITKLHIAFSRVPGQPRHYVQELVSKEKDAVWAALQQGGVVYVCGDAGKMAPAVRKALAGIIAEKQGIDPAAADKRLDAMGADGRYLVDVWASG